jgi:hypothetical protein
MTTLLLPFLSKVANLVPAADLTDSINLLIDLTWLDLGCEPIERRRAIQTPAIFFNTHSKRSHETCWNSSDRSKNWTSTGGRGRCCDATHRNFEQLLRMSDVDLEPTTSVLKKSIPSSDFNSNFICSGRVYFGPLRRKKSLFFSLIAWFDRFENAQWRSESAP